MHNLDYCDVLVIGEELNPDRESLEVHHSALVGKHLDATNSSSGISIYGRGVGPSGAAWGPLCSCGPACDDVSLLCSRRGLHGPLRTGSEAGALQELET